ncbi:putative C2 domain-containing protein [Medicago truncatula]|uniref:Putative C2 domain-containing protein n=1 Tax=Medicago truncatula TaxID=3880 RepID=A0A396IHW5_MEDTR|nr:putative C2 domain-containing protein [Medicago truncatula]
MEYKTLELNLSSAKDLNNVNLFYKMDVYAVVSIFGDPLHKQKTKTPLDREAGTNPTWNFSVKFTFNELLARQNRLTLKITLRCLRNLVDKNIGSVKIPLRELVHDHTGDGELFQHVSYQVILLRRWGPHLRLTPSQIYLLNRNILPDMCTLRLHRIINRLKWVTVTRSKWNMVTRHKTLMVTRHKTITVILNKTVTGYPAQQAYSYEKPAKKSNVGIGVGAGLVAGALLVDF